MSKILKTKLKIFKIEFIELMQYSTIQGLPKVFLSKWTCLKILWLISTLISSCGCAYCTAKLIIDYYSYQTITLIETIREKHSEFPTVSFCHFNRTNFKFEILDFQFNRYDLKNDWQNHLETYTDKRFGVCYRFNSGKNMTGHKIDIKKSKIPGTDYGLKLDLYIPVESTTYADVRVYIHNHSLTHSTIYNDGIVIKSGSWNHFKLTRLFDTKLEEPYNSCFKDVIQFDMNKTVIDFILNKNMTYTQRECIRICQNLKYLENLNVSCKLNSLDDDLYLSCYRSVSDLKVRNETLTFINTFQTNDPYELCADYCPLECDKISLNIDYILNLVNSRSDKHCYGFYYSQLKTYENVSQTFVSMLVYYEELKYTLISQDAKMKIYDLFSNLGGTFGLFLGMGVLSFVEFFEIFITLFITFTTTNSSSNKINIT